MESGTTNEFTPVGVADASNVANTDSADTFQSFIYELFEKNGILNDLRAYLRGHIVNVLKSAQTGDPPACQKHFTQRLEHTSQALNILIAEYLMRLEFSYSFSVFISEIPLANMVFGFSKSLMERKADDNTDMRFKDSDVWSILNYLGVQCDSEHASNIVQMYRSGKHTPLLLCILKCMPMYKENARIEQVSSEESLSSAKSSEPPENRRAQSKNKNLPDNCKHYTACKTCQNKITKLQDKYKKKKKYLGKNTAKTSSSINPVNMESLVTNIGVLEKSLIEEMFQQLKSVYETEVEMVKVEEEKKVRRSMASHLLQLQQKRDEMEELFRAREEELERSVQHKKRFLWGLARALRDQHQHMARAMRDVRAETERLSLKEDSLKTQLAETEQILKKRGEEMRLQISNELKILEGHLESMKRERDNITRERSELEHMKSIQNSPSKVIKIHDMDNENVHSHYDLLRNELAILKKYLESSKLAPKCVIERGTITEPPDCSKSNVALNNAHGVEKCSKSDDFDDKVKTNQVVNDFKKKNVNFSQSNLDEIYHERSRDHSQSSGSSEAGDTAAADLDLDRDRDNDRDLIRRLREENERLKAFARQQRSHIEQLSGGSTRPRTAPAATAPVPNPYHVNTTASANTLNVGWRKGAGEELSVFSNAQPRILVPGDTLPFIGVLRDRHGNARRPLMGQGRAGRVRTWPLAGISKRPASPLRERLTLGAGSSGLGLGGARVPVASCSLQPDCGAYKTIRERLAQQRPRPALSLEINRNREKSPKSVLREAKEKLRKETVKGTPPVSRDKSPNTVLREAKQRLRKLEIEAEAVEKSYLDFRKRQSELRLERCGRARLMEDTHSKDLCKKLDVNRSHSLQKLDETTKNDIEAQFADLQKAVRNDFDKYIREYKTKFDIGETHFRSKPTVKDKVKPIPEAYSIRDKNDDIDTHGNYLETPLNDFRKLYTSARQTVRDDCEINSLTRSIHSDNSSIYSAKTEYDLEPAARHDGLRNAKHRQAELAILKQNISKMYNLENKNIDSDMRIEQQHTNQCQEAEDGNMLKDEVESISEIHDMKPQAQELMLVVQSSVNTREVTLTGNDAEDVVSAQMTIIVSPKRSGPKSADDGGTFMKSSDRPKRSVSPEQAAHLTRNDVLDAIFHADPNHHISSVQMQLELSKDVLEDSISEDEKGEYLDDFSADVDNYNSRSLSRDNHSPISLPKTSEDENFWDS